jgi:hypothetical protein
MGAEGGEQDMSLPGRLTPQHVVDAINGQGFIVYMDHVWSIEELVAKMSEGELERFRGIQGESPKSEELDGSGDSRRDGSLSESGGDSHEGESPIRKETKPRRGSAPS